MHEHQNQRGRGRGRGGEHAAWRGKGSGFHTDAHHSQNPAQDSYGRPNSNFYNNRTGPAVHAYPGTSSNYQATNQSELNTQPTSYINSALFVPSSVQSRYAPTSHQRRFDQPVRLHLFTLPIRKSRVESTRTDEYHKSDNRAPQIHHSGQPAQSAPQPGYYNYPVPETQVSLQAQVLPIRNHPKISRESFKLQQSNTKILQNNYGSLHYTPQ